MNVKSLLKNASGFMAAVLFMASSINMATLQYETWESKDGKLILTGKSIGNHRTLSFTDTLMIEKLTQDSLILSKGDYVLRYASVPSVH